MVRVGRKYREIIAEIVERNPGATFDYIHDIMQDRHNSWAKMAPTRGELRSLLNTMPGIRHNTDGWQRRYYLNR